MADTDVSIKASATADIAELVQWTKAVNDAGDAIARYQQLAASGAAVAAGGGGGAGGGGAPVGGAPSGPPAAGNGTPSAPVAIVPPNTRPVPPTPVAPPNTNPAPGPTFSGPQNDDDDDGSSFGDRFTDGYQRGQRNRNSMAQAVMAGAATGGFAGALGGAVASGMAADQGGGFGERWGGRMGGVVGWLGGPLGSYAGRKIGQTVGWGVDAAVGYGQRLGEGMTNMSLGSSISGFPLAAAEKYMELSRTIAQVNARFSEVDGTVAAFGGTLGYTIQRTAAIVSSLGESADTFTQSGMQRYTGYARRNGIDPVSAMGPLGQLQTMNHGGVEMSEGQLAQLHLASRSMGMGQGQQGAALNVISQIAERMLDQDGSVHVGRAASLASVARDVFQPHWREPGPGGAMDEYVDPRARGSRASQFVGKLDSLMTSRSGPGASMMMRAIGFGTGKMDYITMRGRMDAGMSDPRNFADMVDYINHGAPSGQQAGLGHRYRYLEALSEETGAGLKHHETLALARMMGDEERMNAFRKRDAVTGQTFALDDLRANLTDDERAAFSKSGWLGLGQKEISLGEGVETRIERMMMESGKPIAEAIPHLQNALESIADALVNLSKADLGAMITSIVLNLERNSKALEKWSRPGGSATGTDPLTGTKATIRSDFVRDLITGGRTPSELLQDINIRIAMPGEESGAGGGP